MTHVAILETREALARLEHEWAALLARSEQDDVSLHPAWILAWWDVFGGDDERALRALSVRAHEGGELIGLALLHARPHVHRPRLAFRRLEAMASGESEADEVCSPYLGIVAARGSEAEVARALTRALVRGDAGAWDELVLPSMRRGAMLSRLTSALAVERVRVEVDDRSRAPFVPLPGSYDAYVALLGARRRADLERWSTALEAWARPRGGASGSAVTLVHVKSAGELARGRAILEAVHRERHPDGGAFGSARFRAFHDRVTPALLSMGALDLGWMSVGDRAVAAFYNLRWRGKVWHYQSAHAADVPEEARIGVTLQAMLLRDAIGDGMKEYDFLAGEQDYKMSLALATRPVVAVRAARRSAVELARHAVELVVSRGSRIASSWRRRPSHEHLRSAFQRPS